LLFISLATKEVIYIDPKGTTTDKLNTVTKNVNMHISKTKHLKNYNFSPKKVDHQLQTDGYNCGVFVCYFYEILVGKNLQNFQKKTNIDQYRISIIEILKSNSDIKACCLCGKTLGVINNVFKNVKKFGCGHKFHLSCIRQCTNNCKSCESYIF